LAGDGPGGPGEWVVEYADWRTVDGLTPPFKETPTLNGEQGGSVGMKDIEVNSTVNPKLFEGPAQ
jgi:hypothetical protein